MSNVKIIKDNREKIKTAVGQALIKAVLAGGFVIETEAKISMSAGSHSGVHYVGNPAQSSAPGETPAVQTGVLVNSITTELDHATETEAFANIGTGVVYGPFLEFGTSKMAARPFMRPAVDHTEEKIRDVMSTLFRNEIGQAAS